MKSLNERREAIIRDLVSRNYQTISIKDISTKLYVSQRHAERIVKDIFGSSLSDLRNYYRLEQAKSMLKNAEKSTISILDIALQIGFSSVRTFNKTFKEYTLLTPREYLKRNRK